MALFIPQYGFIYFADAYQFYTCPIFTDLKKIPENRLAKILSFLKSSTVDITKDSRICFILWELRSGFQGIPILNRIVHTKSEHKQSSFTR